LCLAVAFAAADGSPACPGCAAGAGAWAETGHTRTAPAMRTTAPSSETNDTRMTPAAALPLAIGAAMRYGSLSGPYVRYFFFRSP